MLYAFWRCFSFPAVVIPFFLFLPALRYDLEVGAHALSPRFLAIPAEVGVSEMERIASFCVDHTRLERGMYISRVDGDVVTYDIRMKKPNQGDYLANGALHTIEHLFATYARNSVYGPGVIYVGPMGCRTGFYLLTRGLSHADAIRLVQDSFRFMADYAGDIPGASEIECGNYREQDLPGANREARAMLPVLKEWTEERLQYEA